ncbi:MAG: TonB-dependent receptor, partial [Steroidobacteraceae bacterium]
EIVAVPVQNLQINAGVAYLDGEYDDFENGPHFNPTGSPAANTSCAIAPFSPAYPGGQTSVTAGCDLSGNETIQTPKFTASVGASYIVPTSMGQWGFAASLYHNDGYFFEPTNSVEQDAYDLVDASISWTSTDEKYGARLWGKNLLDEEYYSAANSAALGKHYSAAAPLTYGVTFSTHFR